ncbi:MAG: IS481 family transposase [Alphaproteobacteria bacterium]|nr:IS481 family transposase [Alphaproteobacteria bacterium]
MNVHKNARLAPRGRLELARAVTSGESVTSVARRFGTTRKTVRKWVRRFVEGGAEAMFDRSSCPLRSPSRTAESVVEQAKALRVDHRLTQRECGLVLGVPRSTLGRWLRRAGLGRLRSAAPDEPVRRYERQAAGELIHLDIKKLARFRAVGHRIHGDRAVPRSYKAGWQYVHVAIDDHSRVAYVEVLPDEKGATATAFLDRALAWFSDSGVSVERVMTDNGACYRSRRFREAVQAAGARHIYTRPYTPKTNGKAERFIGTLVREWAYGRPYENDAERTAVLPCWLRYYNHEREHSALGYKPPASRLPESGYNLASNNS